MTLTTKYLIQEAKQTFQSREAYLEALQQRPYDQPFWYNHIPNEPSGWSEQHYGPFPPNGLAIIQTILPSANRSFTGMLKNNIYFSSTQNILGTFSFSDKQSFKLVTLAITNGRMNSFGLEGFFSKIFSWSCRTKTTRTPDICSRICK